MFWLGVFDAFIIAGSCRCISDRWVGECRQSTVLRGRSGYVAKADLAVGPVDFDDLSCKKSGCGRFEPRPLRYSLCEARVSVIRCSRVFL